MAHREVSISLAGVVVGVLIGAASLSIAQGESSLSAATFHDAPNAANYMRRRIDERGIKSYRDVPGTNYPTLKEGGSSSSADSVKTEDKKEDKKVTACRATLAVIKTIEDEYNRITPRSVANTERNSLMDRIFTKAKMQYCDGSDDAAAVPAATTSSSSRAAEVDNDCEQYANVLRRTLCNIATSKGQKYP